MIFDFKRYYINIQEWSKLAGPNCSLCKHPLKTDPNLVYCSHCNWSVEFTADVYGCIRPHIVNYKGFGFCRGHSRALHPNAANIDVVYVRDTSDISWEWDPLVNHINIISLRSILEYIKTGEVREIIKRMNARRLAKQLIQPIYV